ncbi:hypothetical protein POTOM_060612 [Populus tomentosa]|uniref:Phospholipase/carboxylesterase/thioesterase domain-containing protein n=1 Tax=Populus tomentosa TaxID=118781 RepID=A0A8X7XR98_POPTO|nr:hypothetical protein POTOM_060612 [Populus tomentosa]
MGLAGDGSKKMRLGITMRKMKPFRLQLSLCKLYGLVAAAANHGPEIVGNSSETCLYLRVHFMEQGEPVLVPIFSCQHGAEHALHQNSHGISKYQKALLYEAVKFGSPWKTKDNAPASADTDNNKKANSNFFMDPPLEHCYILHSRFFSSPKTHISSSSSCQTMAASRSFVLWLHGLVTRALPIPWLVLVDGAKMPSWFDIHEIPMTADSPKDESRSLKAVRNVHAIMDKEIAAGTNPENVFVCGFSQGGLFTDTTLKNDHGFFGGLSVSNVLQVP